MPPMDSGTADGQVYALMPPMDAAMPETRTDAATPTTTSPKSSGGSCQVTPGRSGDVAGWAGALVAVAAIGVTRKRRRR
jgi:MYXO-CTERM domain-containing protein